MTHNFFGQIIFHVIQDTWIAGQIEESYGEFTWMDGTQWDYDNWDRGE